MKDDTVLQILKKYNGTRGSLISTLEEIQKIYGYLPRQALYLVAKHTRNSLSDIYGVATFYRSFNLNPVGKHRIAVCLGTACHVRLAPKVVEEFQRQLKITAGQTTRDKEFTLETVNCLGACALGPVVMVDGHYFSHVMPNQVQDIISKARTGLDKVEIKTDQRIFPIEVSCSRCNHSLMESRHLIDGYPSIKVTISFGNKHGWMLLSCLYGSYTRESEYEVPDNAIVNFFCPHCHANLNSAAQCPECRANMVPMIVKGGGIVQICSRNGCKGHMLDINGVNMNWTREPALEETVESRESNDE
jgi:NADH:ubiquinone oxidoreductase subunit E